MRWNVLAFLILIVVMTCPTWALTIEKSIKVGRKTCDVVTWTDAAGKMRKVALVRSDGDIKRFTGGYIEQYTYFLGDRQVTGKTDETMGDISGLGCAIDHHGGGASSSKSRSTDATTSFILEGAGQCIWRFKSQYHGPSAAAPSHDCAVGLVIDYYIADGRSDVVWSVSYDCSKLADKEISWDARGPYFQFDWDGDGKFFGAQISGIRWGDKYHFKTVDYAGKDSSWDYTKPNTMPYMMLYKSGNAGDAECAVIQTATWAQKPAGGYWWSSKNWGKTGKPMMENWNCPFQLDAYEGYGGEKMAWGNNYGFVGNSAFDCLDFSTKGKGYPYQGYAVLIATGRHSDSPGDTTISSMEAVQQTKLTASKGRVADKALAYAGLTEQLDCAPAGWEAVYGQWLVDCQDNQAAVNFDIGQGSLTSATICFSDFSADKATIALNGKALEIGKDCYISIDHAGKRLYVTLAQPLQGAANALTVN